MSPSENEIAKIKAYRREGELSFFKGKHAKNLEEELSVQVGDVNGVQVNDLNVLET